MKLRKGLLISLLILVLSFIVNLTVNKLFLLDIDETHMVKRAVAITCGELPWVDFKAFTYAPGIYLLLAALFWVFSSSLSVIRYLWVVFRSISCLLAYRAARRLVPPAYGLLPTILLLLVPCVPYKSFYVLFLLANLLALYQLVKEFSKKGLLLCGLIAGFTLCFREDIAGFSAFTCGICLCLHHASLLHAGNSPLTRRIRSFFFTVTQKAALYTSMVLLAFSPLFIFYAVRKNAHNLIHQLVYGHAARWLDQRARDPIHFPGLKRLFPVPDNWDVVFLWAPVFLFLLSAVILAVRFLKNKSFTRQDRYYGVTLLMSILTFNQTYNFATYERLLENGVMIYILGTSLLYSGFSEGWKYLDQRIQRKHVRPILKAGLLMLLLAFPAWFSVYGLTQKTVNERILSLRESESLVKSSPDIWLAKMWLERRTKELRKFVRTKKNPNAVIMVLENALFTYKTTAAEFPRLILNSKHFTEEGLVLDLKHTKPDYFAIERWAFCTFNKLPKPFLEWFKKKYSLSARICYFDVYSRE